MRARSSSLQLARVGVLLIAVGAGAIAAGRATVADGVKPDPIRLEQRMPVGVVDRPAGALAAADNYVATGITAGLDENELRRFAATDIAPAGRQQFIATGESLAQTAGPPPGSRVISSVVAHRLDVYRGGRAEASIWAVTSYWDGAVLPTQSWAVAHLALRWTGARWQIASLRESLTGPVPAVIAGGRDSRSSMLWDRALSGMSSPYYGDS